MNNKRIDYHQFFYFFGNMIKAINASSEFREKERLRAEARHDEAQALYNARKERDLEIVQNMIADGGPVFRMF